MTDGPLLVGQSKRSSDGLAWLILCAALSALAAGIAAGLVVSAGLGWDFANFYDAGRRALAGRIADIYHPTASIGAEVPQGRMRFWSAPISAFLYTPMALLRPVAALVAFKIAGTAAYLLGLGLLRSEVVATRPDRPFTIRDAALGAVLIVLFQPFWTMYRVGGQTTPFVFLLLVAALAAHRRGRLAPTVACLVLASLIKPAFLLVPVLLGLLSGRRMIAALVAGFGAAGLVSLGLLGWPIHREFVSILLQGVSNPAVWFYNSSIYILADALRPIAHSAPITSEGGPLPGLVRLALLSMVLGTLIALVLARRSARLTEAARRRFDILVAVGFALLLSRVVWEHYLAVLFIPLAFLVWWRDALPSAARAVLFAIFVLAVGQNLVLVMAFRSHVEITSTAALLAVSALKAGPLLLFWWLAIRYRRAWVAASV